jgi:hypothetical protein
MLKMVHRPKNNYDTCRLFLLVKFFFLQKNINFSWLRFFSCRKNVIKLFSHTFLLNIFILTLLSLEHSMVQLFIRVLSQKACDMLLNLYGKMYVCMCAIMQVPMCACMMCVGDEERVGRGGEYNCIFFYLQT